MAVAPTIMKPVPRRILPAIVTAQLAGTSLWFAGNAIMPDLQRRAGLAIEAIGDMTTAVQLGFIAGTLVFSFFALVDRFSPRTIFLASALLGASCNATTYFAGAHLWPLLLLRFATGFFLAGIYPVGMKIASGWFDRDLGTGAGLSRWRAGARHRDPAPPRSRPAVGGRHALRVGDRGTGWARHVLVGP